MDAVDLQIAYLLGKNGRLSNREIGRRIGIAEGTVRQRLANLTESGALRVTAQIDIEEVPEAHIALVGLKIDNRRLNECAREVNRLPSVLTTMIVTGRYDLIAVVLALSRQTLVEFVTDELSRIPGVKDSETYVVLKNINHWIPADKLSQMISVNRGAVPEVSAEK
jgi:Lrp/AsnC family transcriptional regulator for asnA, asnC and gidA